jgi:methionyl-tRNA formyltransferase
MYKATMYKDKKDFKVVFFGTPDFAVESLKRILDDGWQVAAVVTAPDKPAGRGRKLKESDVKKFAKEKGLYILQPENLKSDAFVEELRRINPDVGVIVAFRMLPEKVWSLPGHGTFNLHASLLPDYRGAAPIHHAIINGETQTGVTTFFIDNKIDTGEIIEQIAVPISTEDTFGSMYEKLKNIGAGLVIETLEKIRTGNMTTQPQDHGKAIHPAPKLTKENTKINWSWPVEKIYNFIRGLSPYPGAWSYIDIDGNTKRIIIYKADFEQQKHQDVTGKVAIDRKKMRISVPGGYIFPLELKPEGKKKINVKDFINGLRYQSEIYFK